MTFKLKLHPAIDLVRHDGPKGRHYVTPEGHHYRSVTSVIGDMLDDGGIARWKARVGKEEADRVSKEATTRGTRLHSICESYLMGVEPEIMPTDKALFIPIKKLLDAHLDEVHGIECRLYSNELKMAGTTDVLGRFMGVRSVIDFKTSKRRKKQEYILGYFLQATAYSIMAEERTGISYPGLAIIITTGVGDAQLFVGARSQYEKTLRDMLWEYRSKGNQAHGV